jgi:hypothetical protein
LGEIWGIPFLMIVASALFEVWGHSWAAKSGLLNNALFGVLKARRISAHYATLSGFESGVLVLWEKSRILQVKCIPNIPNIPDSGSTTKILSSLRNTQFSSCIPES